MIKQLFIILLLFSSFTGSTLSQTFVHPGGLHTLDDLNRMRDKVAVSESPWIEGWNTLVSDSKSSSTYGMSGGVLANANQRQNMNRDAQAAYLNALRWYISGDVAHAEKAVSIYMAYANTVNQIPSGGTTDILGLGGIGFTAMAMGAEIMRLYEGWAPEDFEKFKFMMKEYFYPVSRDFLTNHKGACPTHYWANWDLNNVSALLAIGILVDDRDIFNEGIEYFKNGVGAGNIHNAIPFVQGNFGQWQESGRDQSHALLGIGLMANICQLAWNQGVDLYGYDNNRFLKGAEYVARTGALSLEAPFFEEYNSCSNRRHRWISSNALGKYHDQPVWEIVYNHYVVQQGLEAPHVEAMAQIMRFANSTNDQLGHGTLTFTLDAASSPLAFTMPPGQPQGLIAKEGIGNVELSWNAAEAMDTKGYTVKRATSPGGPYTTLATWTSRTNPSYTDTDVENGTTYYYVVSANNHAGDGPESAEVAATPMEEGQELPVGWARADIGNLSIEGEASYASVNTGHTFITKGAGSVGETSDAIGFTYGIASGDLTLTARIADFGGVQKTGIMIRESLDPDAKTVLMKIGDAGWRIAGMGARTGTGANMEWIGGNRYTWRPNIWFRITRTGNTFTVYESNNKDVWFEVGSRTIEMGTDVYVGLFNSSGNTTSLNTARFDHVAITGLDGIAPEVPANFTASHGNTEITLNWDEVPAASSYTLKRSTASGGPYEVVATNLNATQYTDNGLENGTTYYYVVSAGNLSGESVNSLEISATPELAIALSPEKVTAESVSGQQINLSWNASLSATSYNVKRATASGGPYTTISSLDTTSFSDTDVNHSITYYYVVSAINELGESEDSEEVSATPGRLGYWNFDETSGTSAGDSWGMNDGTLHSGASWTSGVVNNAVSLDGSSSGYVSFPSGIMSEVNGDFTIATWVRLDEIAVWARILDFGTSNNNSMFLVPKTSTSGEGIRFAIKTSSGYPTLSYNYTWPLDTWTHIAVTLSGDTATMYLNGEPVASSTGFNKRPSDLGNTSNNYLGKGQKSDDPMLKGAIDDFRIYNAALSGAEISDLVGDLVPPTPTTILSVTGDTQKVSLTWAESLKVTSYNVKRSSEAGGPYATIGSTTGTSFSDTTLTDDAVYYYVVSSVNGNGESANSAEVKSTLSGKIGYWKMDETSGTTAADSWANGDGSLHGDATWSEGIADNSVLLDGSGDYVTLPEGLMKTTEDFTIATWVRLDEVATWSRIFDFGTENNNSMFLAPKTSTSGEGIRFAIKTTSGYPTLSYNYTWPLDTWTHIAVTLSGNTATMYLNGEPVASSTQFTKRPSDLGNTTNNYLGKGQNAQDPYLKGAIDDFRILNRALSEAEISDMVGDLLPPAPPTVLSVSGDTQQVSLTWTESPGASSYNIKRATESGGPYTTIGSAIATSFGDTTLTDDEVYYYVVSAVKENNIESDNSDEVKSALSGKLGYWKMDETAGTTAADSWANGDGTLHGDAGWSDGIEDNSLLLDGSGDYVTLPGGLMKTTNDFTIATWVKLDDISTWIRIFDFGTENANSMYLTPQTGVKNEKSTIRFGIKTSKTAQQIVTYDYAWPLDTWTHIAVTLNGNTARMYVNGNLVASNTNFTFRPSNLGFTTNNYLGKGQNAVDPYLNGSIDEFKIYNRALSAEEVAEAMKIKQVISFDPLVKKTIGDAGFAIEAHTSSGLPVHFTSSDSSVAKVVGDTVYITGVGVAAIIAQQDGDSLYRAAEPVAQNFTVLPLDLEVLHKDGDAGNVSNNSIKPYLQLVNNDSIDVAYSELTIRYWFTAENYAGTNTWIDYAELGGNKISMKYESLSEPHNRAYGYIEYGFDPSLGNLIPGSGSGPIQSRLTNSNWSNFDESDDYSYRPNSSYTLNDYITLYRNGYLVWGSEPETVSQELNLKVYSQNKNANTGTSTIHSTLEVRNVGNIPVEYGDLLIRYWFTKDSEAELNYWIDYARLGISNISGSFAKLDPSLDGVNTYFEMSIDPAMGLLHPLSTSGEIQFRIAKSDWSHFDESDDHSYKPKAPLAENDHITVYYQGVLIYGTEPLDDGLQDNGSTNSGEEVVVLAYPNPSDGKFNVRLSSGEIGTVEIYVYDNLGNLTTNSSEIKTSEVYEKEFSLYPANKGVYVVKVFFNDSVIVKSLLIE
ncbi:LamG-like jellyroll fold domain-containing protein [Algoriphagus sp. D3-2-R+10]|uniref:LamG-like jellyroll fold domain-containing protein n=1 Tax=Algoriphagus aurantiacus TaxID=3103948 RepID=UPI002B39D749|nr:LamG-like jellyroll fold domain-containing protein [Algoriphagus sp. D3-2-R+10]MEB2774674.1 LamG-like jellyroll fold domain-containing protein [Algoriphagus sp. D3-2-R+10]